MSSKQSKAGTYYEPMPVDFSILALLPERGIIGGVHWAGVPVRHVTRDVNAEADGATLPGSAVMARLRSMKVAGYVEDFPAVGPRIWARTPEGSAFLATREEVLNRG